MSGPVWAGEGCEQERQELGGRKRRHNFCPSCWPPTQRIDLSAIFWGVSFCQNPALGLFRQTASEDGGNDPEPWANPADLTH